MEGCCVCADDSGTEDNPLVYCDGPKCNVCVHKACYGIARIPVGDWFCSKCLYLRNNSPATPTATSTSSSPSATTVTGETAVISNGDPLHSQNIVKCELCPSKEGALKRTEAGFCHVICALYIPEASFMEPETVMEPIVTSLIPKDRFHQTCYICAEESISPADASSGAKAGCEKSGCKRVFHVTCAQKKGLLCEITRKNSKSTVIYSGFCALHSPADVSGVVDGNRYRKIPLYPRLNQAAERASLSSGYSTPNNPEKTPPPVSTNSTDSSQAVNPPSAAVSESEQPRSSSNKSTASVGSSGTTESIDSGVPFSTSESVAPQSTASQNLVPLAEERAIRKPPKKSFTARMDGAGIPPVSTTSTVTSSHPAFPPVGLFNPSPSPSVEQLRYFGSGAYVTPQELQAQFDLSQQALSRQTPVSHSSMYGVAKASENSGIPPYLGIPNKSGERSTPTLPKKRALSPSILEGNETLTISSLIERTIERATTNPSSMPPVAMPFSTAGQSNGPFGSQMDNNYGKSQETSGKKSKRAPKEPKVDPRRSGNTATIKDLLANSTMSPQTQVQNSSPPVSAQEPNKVPTPKPRAATESEKNPHSDPQFLRDLSAVSPKNNFIRQQDDRHRHAVEKVQHYLNTSVGSEMVSEKTVPSGSSTAARNRRKIQEERPSPKQQSTTASKPEGSPPMSNGKNSRDDISRHVGNGHINGSSHEDEPSLIGGPQAFDSFMMAMSSAGINAAHQLASNTHPTAATALDGFFRMQKELEVLKRKVGELEGLKAFYLTQVQALRTLADKHAHDPVYPIVAPTVPEEVARLLLMLGGDPAVNEDSSAAARNRQPANSDSNASDGLLARLHEPTVPAPAHRSSRDSRPESRVQNPVTTSSVGHYVAPSTQHGLLQGQSPNSTPKPPSRSRLPKEQDGGGRERDSRDPYAHSNGYTASHGSRRSHYPGLEHMEGISSGVISTPAPVVSQPQLLMPNVGAPQFLLQNPQLYSMPMDQRMFSMLPGQFFSPMYQSPLGGFLPAPSPSDYAGLGRMHTPTSSRYQMEDPSGLSHQQSHGSVKREYEMQQREN